MSLWDSIKGIGSDILSGVGGAVVDIAGGFLGNELIGKPNADDAYKQSRQASAEAFERSYGAYKTRYQDTMSDMQAAGLNPILAAGSGGFTVSGQPSMQAAQGYQAPNPNTNFANSARNLAEVKLKKAQKVKTQEEAENAIYERANIKAQKGVLTRKEELLIKQIKIAAETYRKEMSQTKLNLKNAMLSVEKRAQVVAATNNLKTLLNQLKRTDALYGSFVGAWLTAIRETLGSIGAVFGGAGSALIRGGK